MVKGLDIFSKDGMQNGQEVHEEILNVAKQQGNVY